MKFFNGNSKRGGLFKRKDLSGFIPELVVRSDIQQHGQQVSPPRERGLARMAALHAAAKSQAPAEVPNPNYGNQTCAYDKLFDRTKEIYRGKFSDNDDYLHLLLLLSYHMYDQTKDSREYTPDITDDTYNSRDTYDSRDDTRDTRATRESYSVRSLALQSHGTGGYDTSGDYSHQGSREHISAKDTYNRHLIYYNPELDASLTMLRLRQRLRTGLVLLQLTSLLHFSFNRIAPRGTPRCPDDDEVSIASNPDDFNTTIADLLAHREGRTYNGAVQAPRPAPESHDRRTLLLLLFHLTNSRHPSPTIADFARLNAKSATVPLNGRIRHPGSMKLERLTSGECNPHHAAVPNDSTIKKVVGSFGNLNAHSLWGSQSTSGSPPAPPTLVPYLGRLAQRLSQQRMSTDKRKLHTPPLPRNSYHLRSLLLGTVHLVHRPALPKSRPPPMPITQLSLLSLGLRRFLKKFRLEKLRLLLQHPLALLKKYSHPGRLLGTGALGLVSLVTSRSDGHIYAVKKFRPRQPPQESENEYRNKVEAEFKIGKQLNHENLIHTVELIKDMPTKKMVSLNGYLEPDYYIVMEYCAYDFFTLVMLGQMSGGEVGCYFKQIVHGVEFLHGLGLSHRDLKLDNCVVNEYGQLKLIDFGLAVWFYPQGLKELVLARGIVGLDPYLAPEVFECVDLGYDPRVADVWLIAIIYCCMILRRFPWKIPKQLDALFMLFSETFDDDELALLLLDYDGGDHPRGAQRLLRLLPTDMRPVIHHMLNIDLRRRFLIGDVVEDPAFECIEHCHNLSHHEYFIPNNHIHHLVTEEDLKK